MVTIQNAQSGTLILPLADFSGGFIVKDIQGLDPVKATLTSSALAEIDGAQFQHARREPRNITMKLGLEPDYVTTTVASLRSELYDYFMPKSAVTLGFYFDDVLYATTVGVVESMENNMFTADPQVDISLMCYDPDFYAPDPVVVNGTTVSDATTHEIDYEGTSDTGIVFTLTFPGTASELWLYNTRPDNVMNLFRVSGSFLANDIFQVNSNPGSKSVTINRGGTKFSVLYYLDAGADWPSLMRGPNLFRAYASGAGVPYTVVYTPRYGGL
jgi:Siphovirus-type tail component, C-terminal domain